jgi:hypothetical protein
VKHPRSKAPGGLFHVEQPSHIMNEEILFTYTKVPEDYVEDILDIDPA